MRTSGATPINSLTYIPVIAVVIFVVTLAGGPRDFLHLADVFARDLLLVVSNAIASWF